MTRLSSRAQGETQRRLVELLVEELDRAEKGTTIELEVRDRACHRPATGAAPVRILVVDDEPAVRDLTVEILRRSGYKPHGVPTARHALDLLEEEQFDLVVSDVVMPEMTGVGFSTSSAVAGPTSPSS